MNPQEILAKIAKLKNAIESESDPDVKSTYQKKVAALETQIADAEKKVEQKEEKAAAEEKKELSEAEQKISKLKAAIASESDPDVKERYQKKIDALQGTLKEVKEEIKEEKKEISEQKKEIKQAVQEVKSAVKEVRKTAIKKAAVKVTERKKTEVKKTKRKAKLKTIISELDALIAKNKKLKSKYGKEYKGAGKPTDLKRDAARSAKPFGYRFVGKHDYRVPTEQQIRKGLKRGTIDYEARPNRSDVFPKKTVKLADGGTMADGGMAGKNYGYIITDLRILNQIAKKYHLEFDKKYKYYIGNADKNDKGEFLPNYFSLGDRVFRLRYVSGSFHPFLVAVDPYVMVYSKDTNEPAFPNYPNPQWDKDKYYMKAKRDGVMADGGESQGYDDREDEKVVRGYSDDEAYEYAKGGSVKKLEAGVYRVGKPTKLSPILYEQKIVEIFDNGDISTASDYGRKLDDFKSQKYPIITKEKLDAQYKMADGGMMAKGGMSDITTIDILNYPSKKRALNTEINNEVLNKIDRYLTFVPNTKQEYTVKLKGASRGEYGVNKEQGDKIIEIINASGKMADGGMMSKGGAVKKKVVGFSKEDKARYAKPAGWRWKEEALTKRIIERKQLSMSPSKKMRDKYPDFVYYEDRLNKADKNPRRTSADSI